MGRETVFSLITRARATSRLLAPPATRVSTSASRAVEPAGQSARGQPVHVRDRAEPAVDLHRARDVGLGGPVLAELAVRTGKVLVHLGRGVAVTLLAVHRRSALEQGQCVVPTIPWSSSTRARAVAAPATRPGAS